MYAVSLAMRYENFWLLTLCCRHYGFKQYESQLVFIFPFITVQKTIWLHHSDECRIAVDCFCKAKDK